MWTLPRAAVRGTESYWPAGERLAVRVTGWPQVRQGLVVGHRWATPPWGIAGAMRVEERVLIVRCAAGADASDPVAEVAWTHRQHLALHLSGEDLKTTRDLVDGYLDGWLPDGGITLD